MHLIDNNYIKTRGNGPTWHVEFDPTRRPVKSFYEETVIAAEMVWSTKTGKIQLCYSGGVDSEFVLNVFLSLGMTIEPIVMRTQYNHPETDYAFKFCNEKNLKPKIIDLDFDKFVESGKLLSIATNMQCAAWQIPSNMWLASQLDDTVITGDSNPHLRLFPDNNWYLEEREIFHSQINHWTNNNIKGTPFFLSYTPEMFLSFLIDPTMRTLTSQGYPGRLGSHSSKVHIYNRQNKFILEPRQKLHGHELVKQSKISSHPDFEILKKFKNKWGGISYFQYNKLTKELETSTM
jgi:hypothetical protein